MKDATEIRIFIIKEVDEHKHDLARHVAKQFKISRQAVNKHIAKLIKEGILIKSGATRNSTYELIEQRIFSASYHIDVELAEDVVWRQAVIPALPELAPNVFSIVEYGFTEMFNNAIDHSQGAIITVNVSLDAKKIQFIINDNGIGIFKKLKEQFKLEDERHGILELAKGRLTTDPARHSGEGIFWTSRIMDWFSIISKGLAFSSMDGKFRDMLHERDPNNFNGTSVCMEIELDSSKVLSEVFARLSSEEFGFTHTHVPVKLAKVGRENLISRSQAKRLLARIDKFNDVILDFEGVDEIGQAFADEIFRVFANAHTHVKLIPINMSENVTLMVGKALNLKQNPALLSN